MNRLTSKEALELAIIEYEKDLELDKNNQWVKNVLKGLKECQQDLDQLEKHRKIEEEIGIDFITLFKAMKDGFYIKYNDKIVHIFPDKHITINFWYKAINVFIPPKFFIDCKKGADYLSKTIDEEYWFKDYGETWALTREELEDD